MTYKHNHSLYEVQGKTKDDGRIYETRLHKTCGGYVVYLPDAKCGDCGDIPESEVIAVLETEVSEFRKALKIVSDCKPQMDEFLNRVGACLSNPNEAMYAHSQEPRTDDEIALDEWQAETEATRMSDYPI